MHGTIPDQFNVAEFFIDRNLNEGRGDSAALLYQDQTFTYRQIADRVNRAANALRNAGVGRGDRVVLLLFDSPAFVAAFWGAIRLGAVAVPVNTLLTTEECEFVLRDSGARALVVEEKLMEKVEGIAGKLPELKTVLVNGQAPPGFQGFEDQLAAGLGRAPAAATAQSDAAFWLYTSGSTGRPKAAVHRHADMVWCLEFFAKQVLQISSRDRTFSTSKLFFAYGLGNALYFPFGVGASTVLVPERLAAEKIFEAVARFRPTIFFAVPAVFAAMLQVADKGPAELSSLRCLVSAGEALPAPLLERFRERFGLPIVDGLGSTEMLHMFISNRPDDVVPGSSGKIVPGYSARIVDELGIELPAGQLGELHIRGASTAAGYWNRPELTRATFLGEWTVTGDKYVCDSKGYYWYFGRSDDMLKVGGQWVSPLEVETAMLGHPAVLECAVVGAADSDGLTKPKAYVVLKETTAATPEFESDLLKFLRGRLPGFKVPHWIVFTESLPRTATGKVQRFKLRETRSGSLLGPRRPSQGL